MAKNAPPLGALPFGALLPTDDEALAFLLGAEDW